jgi:tellurium resistance protein TerD
MQLTPEATHVSIALAWKPRAGVGADFDLDVVCFMLNAYEKTRNDSDFIFYHQLTSPCGAIKHLGDDPSGSTGEQINVDLAKVSPEIQKIVFAVSIYEAKQRDQNFGMTGSASVTLVDINARRRIASFDLSENACLADTVIFGELYRYNGAWKFRARGESFDGGLAAIAHHFGVETE